MGVTTDRLLDEIERTYRQRYAHFRRVAQAITRDDELARDAVQEGFAGAIRGRRGFRGEAPLDAWLWRAVVNAALRLRRPSESELPDDLESPLLDEVPGDVELDLAPLTERQKLVLFLRYYADLDERTIGRTLGIERGTVSATVHTALATLRRSLEVSR